METDHSVYLHFCAIRFSCIHFQIVFNGHAGRGIREQGKKVARELGDESGDRGNREQVEGVWSRDGVNACLRNC